VCILEDNRYFKIYFIEMGFEVMDWFLVAGDRFH
jgi:hypothetical protein